jgi:hypothetical protein
MSDHVQGEDEKAEKRDEEGCVLAFREMHLGG